MCGIAGIVAGGGHDASALDASVRHMTDALAHRGPDDWGLVSLHADRIRHRSMSRPEGTTDRRAACARGDQTVILGHRRLAIIDLSTGGHQPMRTPDARVWITFNGEIYNYRELRSALESDGVAFRSHSDTEVLLALFAREGPECLRRLRGMFAFAVWDEERRELFLARDRFGMKPLYYAHTSLVPFIFASELNALVSSGCVSTACDEAAEGLFLERGSIPAPHTVYRDLRALPPAHWARWDGTELTIAPYWSLPGVLSNGPARSPETTEKAARVREALIESVKAHMVSDVPVGVFLSGGLDSTAIVAAIRQFYPGPLKTLTIVFPGTRWDEGELARRAATYYGTEQVELEVAEEDFYKEFDRLFAAMDQPTVNGVNTFFVSKMAAQAGIKVALSGLGGDEILGGYDSFVDVPLLRRCLRPLGWVPSLPRLAARLAEHLPTRWAPKLGHLLRAAPGNLESLWQAYRRLFTDGQLLSLGIGPVAPSDANRSARMEGNEPFWSIARLEMGRYMIPQLLRDCDVFSMCHGVEARTPFVDHVFLHAVRAAGSWPRGGAPSYKIALFQHLGSFLPPEHLGRRKAAFTFPFEEWLKRGLTHQVTSGPGLDLRAVLHKPQYRPFADQFLLGRVHWSRIWALYVLERFRARVHDA